MCRVSVLYSQILISRYNMNLTQSQTAVLSKNNIIGFQLEKKNYKFLNKKKGDTSPVVGS